MFGCFLKQQGDLVRTGDQQAGLEEKSAEMLLVPPLGLVAGPLAKIILSVRLKDPRAGQGQAARLHAPTAGTLGDAVISAVEQQVTQIDRLENDPVFGIKFSNPVHEERTEPGEEVAGNHNPRAGQRSLSARQRRQAVDEFGQLRLELDRKSTRLNSSHLG